MARFALADWQTELTRLTVFPTPDAIASPAEITRRTAWWQSITGAQPDETTTSPKKGSATVQGVFESGKLILAIEPQRVDWLFVPTDDLLLSPLFPSLGPVADTVNIFSSAMEKWLARDDVPSIGRMAFGAVFIHLERDRRSGYLRLPEYVPVKVDPESTDFLYQINLPRVPSASGVQGLQINRLSKWSVAARARPMALTVNDREVRPHSSPLAFALRVELDINTAPGFPERIPAERLTEIYRELVQAGLTVALEGVVPQA